MEDEGDECDEGDEGDEAITFALGVPLHLHARAVTFPHPRTGERVTVTAPPPPHIVAACRALGIARRRLTGGAIRDAGVAAAAPTAAV